MISRFLTAFQQLLTNSPEWSLSRVQLFYTAILSNMAVWPTWVIICAVKGEVVDIPAGVGMALGIANGVAGGVYALGRREERLQRPSYQQQAPLKGKDEGEAD